MRRGLTRYDICRYTHYRPRSARAASGFGNASALTCRECGASFELGGQHACTECFGPLEVSYDLPSVTREAIEAGPPNIWRYASLLPVPPDIATRRTTEPGRTPLVRADAWRGSLGMRTLWVKDERSNPTHSFKDRVVAVALAAALELGYRVLACPSTGNLANAVAAAAARAGIESVVLVPANLEPEKILASAAYGCRLIKVDGGYDDVNRLASELAEERDDWAFVNVNVRPYYAEGSKTIGYEIAEDLGWRLPAPDRGAGRLRRAAREDRQGVRRVHLAGPGRCRVHGRRARCSARRPAGARRWPRRSPPGTTSCAR